MSFFSFLYNLVLGPLIILFDVVYAIMFRVTKKEGLAIIALSLAINFLILPLYRRADAMQEEERVRSQKLSRGVAHIKKAFKGDERFMMLQTYYRQNGYKPYYALKGSMSLLLEIPFFIAAFNFLSGLDILAGASFGPIKDLGQPDGLIHFGSHAVNLLPILMTLINIVSGYIYTKGMPLKSKLQLYGMALIFLVFLYSSPAGLVFYWTLNNLFSLVKNVFYKLKNPKFVLAVMSAAVGGAGILYLLFNPMKTMRTQLLAILCMLALAVPLAVILLIKKYRIRISTSDATRTDTVIFALCMATLTALMGILIPSAVIGSSPGEFVNTADFHSPLRYVVQSLALAAGTFVIWMSIFYFFSSPSVRRILSFGAVVFTGASLVDYLFFGKDYGNMSSMLKYDATFYGAKSDSLLNALLVVALGAALVLLMKKQPVIIKSFGIAACASVLIMSSMNIFSIQSTVNEMKRSMEAVSSNKRISLSLDRNEKNVVVIMLDRGIDDFFPYIINEKPALREAFAGFTYYPNTISYGNCTITGSVGLYGGYEYIPAESDKRDNETLIKKHNDALRLMPFVFDDNGYDVTVCDPPIPGFHWPHDLTIYSEHPSVKLYMTKNAFSEGYSPEVVEKLLSRNFFAYSVFRCSPVALHRTLYNKGLYNHSAKTNSLQVTEDIYRASGGIDGVNPQFMGSYAVLKKLPEITCFTDSGKGSFLLFCNDAAHDIIMLQEPDYVPANEVDNSRFEDNPPVRYDADGNRLELKTVTQLTHYQCNMAAMLKIGEWLNYLRENGVYDNTRVIIVSDHGKHMDYLNDMSFNDGKTKRIGSLDDVLTYKSLLLVKDFGSKELTFDQTFMTNADTPSLALSGLVKEPVNPFTGNPINMEGKNVKEQILARTTVMEITNYTGKEKTYPGVTWIGFKGTDVNDLSAWRVIGDKLSGKSSKAKK